MLSHGGSSTVHIYTQTIDRTTQNKQYIEQHNNLGKCGPRPMLTSYTPSFALKLRKKHGKTSFRVDFSKREVFTCDNLELLWGGCVGGAMLKFSAAHLPVCVTYLQLAACEDCIGHSGSSLGTRTANWTQLYSWGWPGHSVLRSETLGFGNMTPCRMFRFLDPWTWGLYCPSCRTAWLTDTAPYHGNPEFSSHYAATWTHPFLTHFLIYGFI